MNPIRGTITSVLAPYFWYLVAAALFVSFVGGTKVGKTYQIGKDAKEIAGVTAKLQKRDESLRSANAAIEDINRQAAIVAKQALEAKAAAADAGKIADAARARLQLEQAAFADRLKAARAVAGCAALLDLDVNKVCKL